MTSWDTIIHEHGPAVWRTAYRLVGNGSDADECMQEAFVAAVAAERRGTIQNWPGLLPGAVAAESSGHADVAHRRRLGMHTGQGPWSALCPGLAMCKRFPYIAVTRLVSGRRMASPKTGLTMAPSAEEGEETVADNADDRQDVWSQDVWPKNVGPQRERLPIRARIAGVSCVATFVLFLFTLYSFGRTPLKWFGGGQETGARFDLVSCLGFLATLYAVSFGILQYRWVKRLSLPKRILGLVGLVGLVAHCAVALVAPASYSGAMAAIGAGAHHVVGAVGGPEDWLIGGNELHIYGTYLVDRPDGLQYTIEYDPGSPEAVPTAREPAISLAIPLVKYACEMDLHSQAATTAGAEVPRLIGVVFFHRTGRTVSCYWVSRTIDEWKALLAKEAE